MATLTTPTSSAKSLLASLAGASPSKGKKPDKPVLADPTLAATIDEFIKNKQAKESAEALMKAAEDQILRAGHDFLVETCQKRGEAMSSVGIGGADGAARLTMTQQNRYSHVPQERADAVREAFGDDFDKYFTETFAINVKEEAANDEAILTEMIEKLGADFVARNFAIRRDLVVQKAFHGAYLTNAAVTEAAKPLLADQTIKPYKASVKIA